MNYILELIEQLNTFLMPNVSEAVEDSPKDINESTEVCTSQNITQEEMECKNTRENISEEIDKTFLQKGLEYCKENKKIIYIGLTVIGIGIIIYNLNVETILNFVQACSIRGNGFYHYVFNNGEGANGLSTLIPKNLALRILEIVQTEDEKLVMFHNSILFEGKAMCKYLPGEIAKFTPEQMTTWYKLWEDWIESRVALWAAVED